MRAALFAATAISTVMVTFFGGVAAESSAASTSCVVGASVNRPYGLEAAADRAVPHAYHGLTSQGSVGWLGFGVVGLANLGIYEDRGETDAWPVSVRGAWRAVAAKCGRAVADRAWAVFVDFPNCQIPCSHGTMYFAKARGAWRLLWAD